MCPGSHVVVSAPRDWMDWGARVCPDCLATIRIEQRGGVNKPEYFVLRLHRPAHPSLYGIEVVVGPSAQLAGLRRSLRFGPTICDDQAMLRLLRAIYGDSQLQVRAS